MTVLFEAEVYLICHLLTFMSVLCSFHRFLIASPAAAVAKYCDEHVCVCVSPRAYLRNHMRDLYRFFCAWCLWPRGRRDFRSCPGHSKALEIFAAAVAKSPITWCSRRDHPVSEKCKWEPENSERRRCGLLAGKGWWECRTRAKSDIYDCHVCTFLCYSISWSQFSNKFTVT